MADSNLCANCGEEFPTTRGLAIHLTRVHPESNNPTKPTQNISELAGKFENIVVKQKISKLANILLSGPAEKYNDPEIRLSPEQERDVNACISELMADMDGGTLKKIGPYLPIIGLVLIVGPIIYEKWERIQAHKAAAGPAPAREPENKPRPSGGLTRHDLQPDIPEGATEDFPE